MWFTRLAVAPLAAVAAGCVQHVMVPQLVRSYAVERPEAVGPDGKPLAARVSVLVANQPYLRDQCVNQLRVGGRPFHSGARLDAVGCVRIGPEDRAEVVVPDTNEEAALAHQLEHLRGRWCHDAQGDPAACPR